MPQKQMVTIFFCEKYRAAFTSAECLDPEASCISHELFCEASPTQSPSSREPLLSVGDLAVFNGPSEPTGERLIISVGRNPLTNAIEYTTARFNVVEWKQEQPFAMTPGGHEELFSHQTFAEKDLYARLDKEHLRASVKALQDMAHKAMVGVPKNTDFDISSGSDGCDDLELRIWIPKKMQTVTDLRRSEKL